MLELRDYQIRTFREAGAAYKEGHREILIVAPTGSGKTIIASHMALQAVRGYQPLEGMNVVRGVPEQTAMLFFAHRDELIQQTVRKFRACGIEPGIIAAGSRNPHPTAPVQVVSTQTFAKRCLSGDTTIPIPRCRYAVYDECHHYRSEMWGLIPSALQGAIMIGLTATPVRSDGRPLGKNAGGIFTKMVVAAQPKELIEHGFLVPWEIVAPGNKQGSGIIAKDPFLLNREYATGLKTIIFCASKKDAEDLAAKFNANGVSAEFIHDGVHKLRRRQILERFERGEFEVLTNCMVLTEGFDDTSITCVQIARPIGSQSLFIQVVGRGARSHPGKGKCLLIDQKGAIHHYGMPDADRDFDLDGEGMKLRAGQRSEGQCKKCGAFFPVGTRCPDCPPVEPQQLGGPTVEIADVEVKKIVSLRRDPQSVVFYWRLILRAERDGRDRLWVAQQYKQRFGQYPENTWYEWFKRLRQGDWENVPDTGREAAELIGYRAPETPRALPA